jgi:hypothetical protein
MLLNSRAELMQQGIFLVLIHKSFQFEACYHFAPPIEISISLYGENQEKFLANKKERYEIAPNLS